MLEIIILYRLTKEIGARAREKGHKAGFYKFLTVLFWIVFEVIGALLGILFLGEGLITYLCAIVGAVVGYSLVYLIVSRLETRADSNFEILDSEN